MTIYLGHVFQLDREKIWQPIDIDSGKERHVYRSLRRHEGKPNLKLTRVVGSNAAQLEIFNSKIARRFKQDELSALNNLNCVWRE